MRTSGGLKESYVSRIPIGSVVSSRKDARVRGRLDIQLTERCNNNCAHCCVNLPAEDVRARARELSTEEITGIVEEAASLNHMGVRFTGGEPLLRTDFADLYLAARRMGLRVLLFTNATLVTPEIADLLAHVPPLEKVEVTIYGMTREVYEAASRAPGTYETAWRGIGLLQERNIPLVVKGALLPRNLSELQQFERWAATLPSMDTPPGKAMFFDLRCRRDDEAKNRRIRKLRLSPEQGVTVLYADREGAIRDMQAFMAKFSGPHGDRLFSCGIVGCVDPYGYLYPCVTLRHPDTAYDLRNGSLQEALDVFLPSLRELRTTNPSYLERCARCFLKDHCEQCPSKSWAEHGTLDTPVEYCCDVTHAQARYFGLLTHGEKAWEVADWRDRIDMFLSKTPVSA